MMTRNKNSTIAIFGDLHGRVLLAFWLVKRWQEENDRSIDYILCTGDAGIFRGFEYMDKSSRRYAEKYPDELGFSKFFLKQRGACSSLETHPVADKIFKDVKCRLYFVPGNHEDHQFIGYIRHNYSRDFSSPFPVDINWEKGEKELSINDDFNGYEKIWCLPEGPVVLLPGPLSDETWEPGYNIKIGAINGIDAFTMPEAWNKPKPGTVDILLSHETFKGRLYGVHESGKKDNLGSENLFKFIKTLGPSWHFFGHHHQYCPEMTIKSETGENIHSVGLNQLFFETRDSVITQGGFGVLAVSSNGEKKFDFSIVEDEWLKNLHYSEVSEVL